MEQNKQADPRSHGARQQQAAPRPALFLDRDGVINEETSYLYRKEDVRWVDGIFSLVRTAKSLGYAVVVVTNQSGIGRELYSTEDFHRLMDWMRGEFLRQGGELDAVYHCPYHPDGAGPWRREHPDRKPGPGMLLRAAADLHLDLQRSLLVGDRCSDLGAAHAAGLLQAFLLEGTEPRPCPEKAITIRRLEEVEVWLRQKAR